MLEATASDCRMVVPVMLGLMGIVVQQCLAYTKLGEKTGIDITGID